MPEEKREQKRPAVKARKTEAQLSKGARRRQRSGGGQSRADNQAYGHRTVRHAGPAISITVQIPQLRKPKPSRPGVANTKPAPKHGAAGDAARQPARRRPLWLALALPVAILIGVFVWINPGKQTQKRPAQPVAAAERTEPDYEPLVPSAEKANSTTYDGKRNLVSYNVVFSGAKLTVSQQSLPENFAKDPTTVMKAAESIKATQQISTDKGMLFVATNEIAGDQLAVLADKKVLVFIHCNTKLDEVTWKSFVDLLKSESWESVAKAS